MSDTKTPAPPRRPAARQKVPAFARYEGTSAWHKDRRRMRAYARFKAAQKQAQKQAQTQAQTQPQK